MIFRVARHTNNLEPLIFFYTKIIGLEILGDFKDHDNYNGVFIGNKNHDWHLEFTQSAEKANHAFDEDDILVFYPRSQNELNEILKRFSNNNIPSVKPKNPYWQINGTMVKDPDGYNILISGIKIDS